MAVARSPLFATYQESSLYAFNGLRTKRENVIYSDRVHGRDDSVVWVPGHPKFSLVTTIHQDDQRIAVRICRQSVQRPLDAAVNILVM